MLYKSTVLYQNIEVLDWKIKLTSLSKIWKYPLDQQLLMCAWALHQYKVKYNLARHKQQHLCGCYTDNLKGHHLSRSQDPELLPSSQLSESKIGGVQESPLHVYLDGPLTTKPLGQVSTMESPILYNVWNGDSVSPSGTVGLRHSVPADRETFQMHLVEQNTQGIQADFVHSTKWFDVIDHIGSVLMLPFEQKNGGLRIPGFHWETAFSSINGRTCYGNDFRYS